jgi:hypothetical protein
VLGPRGWRCAASISDGDEVLVVAAPSGAEPPSFPSLWPPRRTTSTGLVATMDTSCVACVLTQACPFFPRARSLLRTWGYWSAAVARSCEVPREERVAVRSGDLRSVVEPPDVLGNDDPSGGPDAAIGEVGYVPDPRFGGPEGSLAVTCTLASTDRGLCDAALGLAARDWR